MRCADCGHDRCAPYALTGPRPAYCVCPDGFTEVTLVEGAQRAAEQAARKRWNAERALPGESPYIGRH